MLNKFAMFDPQYVTKTSEEGGIMRMRERSYWSVST